MKAIEVGLSFVLVVCVTGLRAHWICWGLYPIFLKTVVRNSSSWVRESWSQRALALCIKEARIDWLFAGWWCEGSYSNFVYIFLVKHLTILEGDGTSNPSHTQYPVHLFIIQQRYSQVGVSYQNCFGVHSLLE